MPRGFLSEDTKRGDEDDVVVIEDARCIRRSASGAAVLVRVNGKDKWIPQSVIHDDSEVYEPGGEGKLIVRGWFARKEGLD